MKIVITSLTSLTSLALCGALVTGCSEKAADTGAEAEVMDGTKGKQDPQEMEEAEELLEGLQGLEAAELALVQAQGDCPVSGEPLGSMGAPIRKEVDGRVVFLCCKSCVKKFDADPAKYIAMLDEE